jgi:YD repeat-containing protein
MRGYASSGAREKRCLWNPASVSRIVSETEVDPSSRKWLLIGLLLVALAAVARLGITAYEYRKFQAAGADAERKRQAAAAEAVEARFRPTEAARQLLDRTDAVAPRLDGEYPCVFASLEDSKPRPQLGKCALPTEHSGPVDHLEADLRYGNFVVRQSDLYLKDVFDVPLTRSYNSGDYLHSNPVHAFGKFTNHPFDWSLAGTRNPYTHMFSVLEDGDFLYFDRVSQGTSYADAVYQHTETSTTFYKAVIAWNGDGWTLSRTDGSVILFPEAYGATNTAQGAPYATRDANGNTLKLIRDAKRNLMEIRTPHDHTIKFKYDDQSHIVHAEDDQGHSADYRYDANRMLTDATLSSGHARHYSYDGDLMITIEDENQNVLVRNSYDHRWLVQQDFGHREIYSYSYTGSDGPYAASATVTLPDGTRTTVEVASSVPEARKHPPR